MTDETLRNPGVHFPPPILFVAGLALGWAVGWWFPIPILPAGLRAVGLVAGWSFIGLALALVGWAMGTFRLMKTGIYPNQPATSIVARGPYRFTRNPMYVGMTAISVGTALVVNSMWMIVTLPVVIWLLTVLVIRREEAYLSSAFGSSYDEYRRTVRRWI